MAAILKKQELTAGREASRSTKLASLARVQEPTKTDVSEGQLAINDLAQFAKAPPSGIFQNYNGSWFALQNCIMLLKFDSIISKNGIDIRICL